MTGHARTHTHAHSINVVRSYGLVFVVGPHVYCHASPSHERTNAHAPMGWGLATLAGRGSGLWRSSHFLSVRFGVSRVSIPGMGHIASPG